MTSRRTAWEGHTGRSQPVPAQWTADCPHTMCILTHTSGFAQRGILMHMACGPTIVTLVQGVGQNTLLSMCQGFFCSIQKEIPNWQRAISSVLQAPGSECQWLLAFSFRFSVPQLEEAPSHSCQLLSSQRAQAPWQLSELFLQLLLLCGALGGSLMITASHCRSALPVSNRLCHSSHGSLPVVIGLYHWSLGCCRAHCPQ